MSDPYAQMRFRHIHTRAVMADGRVITAYHSYPLGVGKDVYDKMDADLVRAFGNDGSRTVGIPMPVVREEPRDAVQSQGVDEAALERACRAVAADHYAKRFKKDACDPHVQMNVDANWQVFLHDACTAIAAYLGAAK